MYSVRVEDEYVGLMGRYVVEGQAIVPGAPLLDIMTPDGVVETITSEGWGVVAHIEGHRVFIKDDEDRSQEGDDEDDSEDGETAQGRSSSGGMSIIFSKGEIICHIVARQDRVVRGKGLIPRASPALRLRRTLGLAV